MNICVLGSDVLELLVLHSNWFDPRCELIMQIHAMNTIKC